MRFERVFRYFAWWCLVVALYFPLNAFVTSARFGGLLAGLLKMAALVLILLLVAIPVARDARRFAEQYPKEAQDAGVMNPGDRFGAMSLMLAKTSDEPRAAQVQWELRFAEGFVVVAILTYFVLDVLTALHAV